MEVIADMARVDITADMNDEDETGHVWTFLDEARDPSVILHGAIAMPSSSPVTPMRRPSPK
ncbi:MAG: hypothetical protein M3450_01710 [Actinomycetota bacterium]|nr:hypothetical protein [Actinomycetota bacterium]